MLFQATSLLMEINGNPWRCVIWTHYLQIKCTDTQMAELQARLERIFSS